MAAMAKVTISLPADMLEEVDAIAREQNAPRSAIIAEMVKRSLKEQIEQEMADGYKALAEEHRKFAREAFPLAQEVWHEWK